jgi:prepilin-type N-terminal cleavage/methylation domain-containing protein
MNDRAHDKAFTLVELMISLAIVSLIVTMVYGSYAATSRTLDVYNSRMTCSERAHLVLRLLARQIRGACPPAHGAASMEGQPFSTSPEIRRTNRPLPNSMSQTAAEAFRGDAHEPRGEILCLTTTGGFAAGLDSRGGLSRITYRYEAPGGVLSISCEPLVYDAEGRRSPPVRRPVLRGVTGIELEFYDGRRWQPRWDGRQTGSLPRAVRMALRIVDESGRTHRYQTAMPIASQCNTPRQSQRAAGRP